MENIKVIAFDADDTLWVNEPYFRETEQKFTELLKEFLPENEINKELLKIEIANISIYGFGIKGFVLSMIETASKISGKSLDVDLVTKIIDLGKEMLNKPVELLKGVEAVLKSLNGDYKLVLATKGDLLDQERKLIKSGLEKHFHHIEVMSDKKPNDYKKLLKHLDCNPVNFLMVGNSVKSDIIPVLDIGAKAIHVPYHTTWSHEEVKGSLAEYNYLEVENISEVSEILK